MKIERISEHKIRAYLTDEDETQLYADDADTLADRIKDVMIGAAKAQFGLSFIKSDCDMTRQSCYTLTARDEKRKKTDGVKKHAAVFCFGDGASLKTACRLLFDGKEENGVLYRDPRGKAYYLLTEYDGADGDNALPYRLLSLSELCTSYQTNKKPVILWLNEHCEIIFEKNAVGRIAKSEKTW